MDAQTIQTYNKIAQKYDEETADFWEQFGGTFIDAFVAAVGKGKVLNVGSGPGRDGLLLQKAGLSVTCLDASEAMVAVTEERGLHSVLGDFTDIMFDEHSFDGVWAYTSLVHVPKAEVDKSMSEIRRVLKPEGVLALGMIEGMEEKYRNAFGEDLPCWFSYYTKDEIEKLLERHNFKIEYFDTFKPGSKRFLQFVSRKL